MILDVDIASLADNPSYLRQLRRRQRLRFEVLWCLAEHDLDALVPPSTIPTVEIPDHQPFEELHSELASYTGLPAVIVPAGFMPEGLPVGMELLGRAFAERRLLKLAYEHQMDHRRPPRSSGPRRRPQATGPAAWLRRRTGRGRRRASRGRSQ